MLIRLLGLAVLIFGVLALIGTATGVHPDPFVKWFSTGLSAVIVLLGWKLFRRKKAPTRVDQDPASSLSVHAPSPDAPEFTASSDATVALPTSTQIPLASAADNPLPAPVGTSSALKVLKKQHVAFENVKHLVGIPHQKAKSRFNIVLLDEGIILIEAKSNLELYRLRWNLLEGVETGDSRSAQDRAEGNALMSGAIGSGKIGWGGIVAIDILNAMRSRHPLILRHRTHPKDPMSSVIVFDTFDNELIANAILAKRSSLLADGKITFDQEG